VAFFVSVGRFLRGFCKCSSGAVTVDWVALVAVVCSMIFIVLSILVNDPYVDAATVISDRTLEAVEF
jgi:hypothetical protein